METLLACMETCLRSGMHGDMFEGVQPHKGRGQVRSPTKDADRGVHVQPLVLNRGAHLQPLVLNRGAHVQHGTFCITVPFNQAWLGFDTHTCRWCSSFHSCAVRA